VDEVNRVPDALVRKHSGTSLDVATEARRLLDALDKRRTIPPMAPAARLSLPDAYRVSRAVADRRMARGETPIGRKIGFTNRTIWAEYGVDHPIYGPIYDSTVVFADESINSFSLGPFVQPRIEPEILFGLAGTPDPAMDERELLGCLDWIAHGFEIVQSLFPDWRFAAADCVAAFGLHGALICGPRWSLAGIAPDAASAALRSFSIELFRDGSLVDEGRAANVLDGPLLALRHLVRTLADDAEAQQLGAGEIVTTGTLTRAFPVLPGERWTTTLHGFERSGLSVPGLDIRFGA